MRQGKRAAVLTSSLEGLGARGAAVAAEEGQGCWARTPGAVPGADSSSEVVPVPTSPLPQPPCQVRRLHLEAQPMKALVWPRWVHRPRPRSPESPAPQAGRWGRPGLRRSPAPSSSASRGGSSSKSGTVGWRRCMVGRPDQGPRHRKAGEAAPYNPRPQWPPREEVTSPPPPPRQREGNSCGAETRLRPSIIHGGPLPAPSPPASGP